MTTLSATACEDIASGIVIGLVKRGISQVDCERILRLALRTVECLGPMRDGAFDERKSGDG
jgi:hypothetical protein